MGGRKKEIKMNVFCCSEKKKKTTLFWKRNQYVQKCNLSVHFMISLNMWNWYKLVRNILLKRQVPSKGIRVLYMSLTNKCPASLFITGNGKIMCDFKAAIAIFHIQSMISTAQALLTSHLPNTSGLLLDNVHCHIQKRSSRMDRGE